MPKLSIIVPIYNAEKYLSECIESILNQTFQNFELILVDDGSTDSCPRLCDFYEKANSKVKVIHQKNMGVAVARNAGIDMAEGEYITFVDSDDYIDINMYERMISVAIKYTCDLVVCDCIKESPGYSEIYTHNIPGGFYNEKKYQEDYYPSLIILPNMEYPITISNAVCLIKSDIIKKHSIRYEKGIVYSEDWLFGAMVAVNANNLYYMKNDAFYHYRMNPESVTHVFKKDKWQQYKKLYARFKQEFLRYDEYEFETQIYKVLLFLVYNSVGDVLRNNQMSIRERKKMIKEIVQDMEVKEMFRKIKIRELQISLKLKIQTLLYKYEMGLYFLCLYYADKG